MLPSLLSLSLPLAHWILSLACRVHMLVKVELLLENDGENDVGMWTVSTIIALREP